MDNLEIYDVILFGTGFIQCLLASLLCKDGKKILILDKERFSGGANGSIADLDAFEKQFTDPLPKKFGDWNIDLTPMVFLGNDRILKILKTVGVKIDCKPINEVKIFLNNGFVTVPNSVQQINSLTVLSELDKSVYQSLMKSRVSDAKKKNATETSEAFLLQQNMGEKARKILLQGMLSDLSSSSYETLLSTLQRYCNFHNHEASVLLYPLYGLGEITNGLLKRISTSGGRFMLNKPIEKVVVSGNMVKVEARGVKAFGRFVVGAPSYFKTVKGNSQKVLRILCLFDSCRVFPESDVHRSCFLTLPSSELKRKSDVYILILGSDHCITPKGLFIAHLITLLESQDPEAEAKDILKLLGSAVAISVKTETIYHRPRSDDDRILITSSCGPSMSWEAIGEDVQRLYKLISLKELAFDC